MSGFRPESRSRAASVLGLPTSPELNVTWRCKFVKSTISKSTRPRRPTPAAARYKPSGAPNPPVPISMTLALFSFSCPSMPTSGMIRCRLYRKIASFERLAAAFAASCAPVIGCTLVAIAKTSCNRRHDADRVAVFCWGIFFRQIANIFVVHINVHEAAQLSVLGKQMLTQVSKFGRQPPQRFADGPRFHLRRIALSCIGAQRRRNNHFHSHLNFSSLKLLPSRMIANRNFLTSIFRTVIAQPPGRHFCRLTFGHAHNDVAVPRPSMLAVILAPPRRVIRMWMIPAHNVQFFLPRRFLSVAHVFGGDRKAVVRGIFAAVHQGEQRENFAEWQLHASRCGNPVRAGVVAAQQRPATFVRISLRAVRPT